jgi:hypothetical protein
VKAVVPWYILYVIDEGGARKNMFVLIDAVHRILEGQLGAAVPLILREYRT